MLSATEEQTITESKRRSWLRHFRFGFNLMIAIGVGVYGFVLLGFEQPNSPGYTSATIIMGAMLIVLAGIILFFVIRNIVKS